MGNITEDVVEALTNEFRDIMEMVTDNVKVTRLPAAGGSYCLWKFDVHAPTHYLEGEKDTNPKNTDDITFWLDVKEGYPRTKPCVYFKSNFRLAGANTFRNGVECIDEWKYDANHASGNSSLVTTVRKTIKDIIHDPSVARFDSPANGDMINWQKKNIDNHTFPTCRLSHVFKMDTGMSISKLPELPTKRNADVPPALPVRP